MIPTQTQKCKLNDRTEKTSGIIHLMITSLCLRNCRYCCNKFYDLDDIPHVTSDELQCAHTLCLTGGEPFMFCNPPVYAKFFKQQYPNIKKVFVYSNSFELWLYLISRRTDGIDDGRLDGIDGVNVSIKSIDDEESFEYIKNQPGILRMNHNRLYVFGDKIPEDTGNFEVFTREWQTEFVPADDSIFRLV